MNWRVHRPEPGSWAVTNPGGDRTLDGLPSQRAAFDLARSLAGIEAMLTKVVKPTKPFSGRR